jgi:RNA recognition motif-containing protein
MDNSKLYVGNLSYQIVADQLSQLFGQAGTVTDAVVITDRQSGRSKGFGFVTMSSAEEAQKAIDMFNEQDFEGRKMIVSVARPMQPRDDRGPNRF